MRKQPIAAIINFCSNESRFIGPCLEQALLFANQVIVPVCDHFFDGTPENRPLLESIYRAYPQCLFVEYPFIPALIPRRIFESVSPAHFWHSCSRLVGRSCLDKTSEALLFLDADEIPDGALFAEWLEANDFHQHVVMKLSNYWYFREPIHQALSWEDSVVLVQTRAVTPELLLQEEERDALYDRLPGPKRRHVTACNGRPMFHHYSWVRSQEEMLKKVEAWGHRGDRNWKELVDKEFLAPFQGTDFVHGYQYTQVVSPFVPQNGGTPSFVQVGEPNVVRLSEQELLELLKWKSHPFRWWLKASFRLDF